MSLFFRFNICFVPSVCFLGLPLLLKELSANGGMGAVMLVTGVRGQCGLRRAGSSSGFLGLLSAQIYLLAYLDAGCVGLGI